MIATLLRRGAAWLVLWALLFWLWLLLAGDWNRVELAAAALASALAAAGGEAARSQAGARVRLPLVWVARAATVPLLVFADFGLLVWALLESAARREVRRGAFRAHPFPAGGADPTSRGIRAWVGLTATYSPNAYVVDIDATRDLILLHDLIPWPPSESPG